MGIALNGDFNRENDYNPIDLGVHYFQTNPNVIKTRSTLDHNPNNRPPGAGHCSTGDSPKGDALTAGLALLWDDLGGNSDDWWQKSLKVSKVRPKSQTEEEYVNPWY